MYLTPLKRLESLLNNFQSNIIITYTVLKIDFLEIN